MENFIRKLLNDKGLSLSDIERELNLRGYKVTRAAIGHWTSKNPETYRNPPLKDPFFIEVFSDVLRITPSELLEMAGIIKHEDKHTHIAYQVAQIVEKLPQEKQELVLSLAKQLRG